MHYIPLLMYYIPLLMYYTPLRVHYAPLSTKRDQTDGCTFSPLSMHDQNMNYEFHPLGNTRRLIDCIGPTC